MKCKSQEKCINIEKKEGEKGRKESRYVLYLWGNTATPASSMLKVLQSTERCGEKASDRERERGEKGSSCQQTCDAHTEGSVWLRVHSALQPSRDVQRESESESEREESMHMCGGNSMRT